MQFRNIGSKINDFLDKKKNDFGRKVVMKGKSDEVDWEINNKLTNKGEIESSLELSHKFKKERLLFKTCNTTAPTFRLTSTRFEPNFKAIAEVEDPNVKLKIHRKNPKYTFDAINNYNYTLGEYNSELSFVYAAPKNVSVGGKVKCEGNREDGGLALVDYNVGAQFERNENQTFSFSTKDSLQVISAGARFKVRQATGYARVEFNRKNAADDEAANPLSFAVGLKKSINDNSSLAGIYRSDNSATLMYENRFPETGIEAKMGANFNLTARPVEATMTYKVVFG